MITKFFKEFDVFAAPATLRTKTESETTSICAGTFSFLLVVLFGYIFITNAIDIVALQDIESKQVPGRYSEDQKQYKNFSFAFGINYLPPRLLSTYLSVSIQNRTKIDDETGQSSFTQIQVQKCIPDKWQYLGDDYEQQFEKKRMNNFFCPAEEEKVRLKGTLFMNQYSYIVIQVFPCRNRSIFGDPCVSPENMDVFWKSSSQYFQLSLYLLENQLRIDEKESLRTALNTDTRMIFSYYTRTTASIYFGSYEVETDVGYLPFRQIVEEKGIYFSNIQKENYFLSLDKEHEDVPYVRIVLQMSDQKVIVSRQVGKLDDMLSYVGGLFSLIITFLSFFMLSYNQYRYELLVAKAAFNPNSSGQKVLQKDFNFLRYMKYSLYDWINVLFCCQMQWKDCQEIQKTRGEINELMDVSRVFRKIRNFDVAFLHLMTKNQQVCLNLVQPFSIEQSKQIRLFSDYYDAIMQGKSAITIQDVKLASVDILTAVVQGSRIQKSSILFSGNLLNKNQSKIIDIAFQRFPQIVQEAQQVELEEDLFEVQMKIAEYFYNCEQKSRIVIQQKIPIKILARLRLRKQEALENLTRKKEQNIAAAISENRFVNFE